MRAEHEAASPIFRRPPQCLITRAARSQNAAAHSVVRRDVARTRQSPRRASFG